MLLFLFLYIVQCFEPVPDSAVVVQAFHWINISFPTPTQAKFYLENEIWRNVTMNGLKVDEEGNFYVSFPRWKGNMEYVPTLAKLDVKTGLFHAYPNWEMNMNPDPKYGLQSILGFEIDSKKRMWILDQSHIDSVVPAPEFGVKLVIYDMTEEKIIHTEYFDDTIAPLNSSFFNDVVVDMDRDIAYITDSGILSIPENPAIVVFDFTTLQTKRVLIQQTSTNANSSMTFKVDGNLCMENGVMMTGADGIALSCDYEVLYICPLTSRRVYGIETKYLRELDDVDDKIVSVGDKLSVSDGLILDGKGMFYSGDIEHNGVLMTDEMMMRKYVTSLRSSTDILPGIKRITQSETDLWQDTFSISKNYLYWTNNNLCNWLQGYLDYSEINYRIWKIEIGANSYVYGCEK